MLAGPHPRSRSLGDSAPLSGPQALFNARAAPPPLALARRLRASLGAAGAFQCSRGPTPARARSAPPRLSRAAGAFQCSRDSTPLALARRLRASLGPQALFNARGAPPPLAR